MRGATLLETLIVLVIAGIVAAFALPALGGLLADQRRVGATNAIVTALNHARHSSIVHARAYGVCPTGDGDRCGEDWRDGWFVFEEVRGWRGHDPVDERSVVARFEPPRGAVLIVSNRARYTFRPHRRRATNGTLVVCEPGRAGRAVVVAPTGRVRTTAEVPDWVTGCP